MRRIIVFCMVLAFIVTGCGGKPDPNDMITASNFQLNTVVTVNLYGTKDESIFDDVFGEIDRLEKRLSRKSTGGDLEELLSYKVPDSDLKRLALSSGKNFEEVSDDTIFLLQEGKRYSRLTGGLFDVTIGPLVSLWDIREGSGHFPSEDELNKAMALIDHEEISIDGNKAMLKRTGMEADFGAIAKGYIADQVKSFLLQRGITSGIINLGGNVILIGAKPDGEKFHIGIQDPDGATGEYMGVVEIADKSLVTSGPYERFFLHEGKRYHHILNPKTGFPVENEILQVTIISGDSVTGDALSTSVFLLGLKKGMQLIDQTPGVSAILVTKDKKVYLSNEFDETFYIENTQYTLGEGDS